MITEIVTFSNYTPNDHEKASQRIVREQEGLISLHSGRQAKDGSIGYWIIGWESLDHHRKFQEKDIYIPFKESIKNFGTQTDMIHAVFEPAQLLLKALSSPAIQYSCLTLGAEENRAKLEGLFDAWATSPGVVTGPYIVRGITVENGQQYAVLMGWESIEEQETRAKLPEAIQSAEILKSLVADVKYEFIITA